MQLAVVILSTHEGDYLRVSLPRTRRALPDAKLFVVTPIDDGESQAIATAMRAQTISVPKETYTKDNSTFNYAGLAKLGQEHALNAIKGPCWTIVTRAQICLDESIAQIDLTSLDQEAVYGTGVKEVLSNANLITFKCEEPNSEEVRKLIPDSNFLMSYGHGPKFDVWSANTKEAVTRFLNNFGSKYMIQKKLAHLGLLNADIDQRNTHRWGDPRSKVRIAPVHPGTVEKETKPKEETTKDEKPKDEKPKEETPKDELPKDEKPKDETPKDEKPKDTKTTETIGKNDKPKESLPNPKEPIPNPTNEQELLKKEKEDAQEDPVPQKEFGTVWKNSKYIKHAKFVSTLELDEESSSKARAEPDTQQNVPLATASVAEKMNENVEEKINKAFPKKFASNPWKHVFVE